MDGWLRKVEGKFGKWNLAVGVEGRQIVTKVLQNLPETDAPCNNFVTNN